MSNQRKKSKTAKKTETSSNVLRRLMHGQVVSSDFFARNWIPMLLILFITLVYISEGYTCKTKKEDILASERQHNVVKAERVRVQSEYMSRIRESAMQELVDTMGLGLAVREMPPYEVTANSANN